MRNVIYENYVVSIFMWRFCECLAQGLFSVVRGHYHYDFFPGNHINSTLTFLARVTFLVTTRIGEKFEKSVVHLHAEPVKGEGGTWQLIQTQNKLIR